MWANFWTSTKKVLAAWSEDKVSRLSAALAYYTLFSIAPLLIICISLAGFFFGPEAARGQIVEQISGLVGPETGMQIQTMIQSANKPNTAIFAQIAGVVMLLLGASGVFGELQSGLNTIWGAKPDPKQGWWTVIKDRFLSFSMILVVAFLLLISLVLNALLTAFSDSVTGLIGIEALATTVSFIFSFLIVTLLFAMIYKILPYEEIAWEDVWQGALFASILFTIGKLLLGLYISQVEVSSTFGAAGSLVVILIWAFYSAQILFIGAEITKIVFTNKRNNKAS